MFIGHFALGFAAKRANPRVSLAALFGAAQFADLLWPVLLAVGVEQVRIDPGNTAFTPLDFVSYPYSHSLVLLIMWGVVFAAIYRAATGRNGRVFVVLAALVVSHWMLDWITHRPDMPIYPGGAKYGLGLWNSVPLTMAIEGAMFAAGLWIYFQCTRPRDRIGRWGLISLLALLVAVYFANVSSGPPPSVNAIIIGAGLGVVLMTVWSWWADAHREAILSREGRQT